VTARDIRVSTREIVALEEDRAGDEHERYMLGTCLEHALKIHDMY
jgi:hypothetical protein